MSLKDILVHVDEARACAARLDYAIRLARFHGAHLTGLYTIPPLTVPGYVAVEFPLEALEAQESNLQEQASAARQRFEVATGEAGISAEWRCEQGHYAPLCARNARYADLLILGQNDAEDPRDNPENAPGEVVLRSGRPVLVVPYIGAPKTLCENIMVGWDGRRESIRAVNDALPLLRTAVTVKVVSIQDHSSDDSQAPSDADIVRHLGRHGVDAEALISYSGGVDTGNALLDQVADLNADLLVMGAWGHSRLREWVMGGATRQVLGEMTVPVLMAH